MSENYFFPRELWSGKYKELGNNARVAYAVLNDLLKTSEAKGWINATGEKFIRCKQEYLAKLVGVKRCAIMEILNSLEDVGLIRRERSGRTLPDDIYLYSLSEPLTKPYEESEDDTWYHLGKYLIVKCEESGLNVLDLDSEKNFETLSKLLNIYDARETLASILGVAQRMRRVK